MMVLQNCDIWEMFRSVQFQQDKIKGGKIEQLDLSKILTSSADCRSSKSCPKYKPNTPIESAALPLSTGSKYLLFLFTLGLFISKTKLPFSAFCLAFRYEND